MDESLVKDRAYASFASTSENASQTAATFSQAAKTQEYTPDDRPAGGTTSPHVSTCAVQTAASGSEIRLAAEDAARAAERARDVAKAEERAVERTAAERARGNRKARARCPRGMISKAAPVAAFWP